MERNKRWDYDYKEAENNKSDGEVYSSAGEAEQTEDISRRSEKKNTLKRERRSSSDDERRSRSDHRRRHRRHRRRSSSYSKSTSRSPNSGRHRRHRRHRSRHSDENSSDSGDSDYNGRWGDERADENYKSQVPNNTVMVRGLASHLTEFDIRQDLLKCCITVKDVRLIRHRDTGISRGFAFVEFLTVAEAVRWMETKKGILLLQDKYECYLIYSSSKVPLSDSGNKGVGGADWCCSNCNGYNFKRRDYCYKCNEARPPDQDAEITSEISNYPTTTVMLYDLDILTTEENVLRAFESRPSLASIPIRSVRVAREAGTNMSRGICYVESNNLADAARLYGIFIRDPFEVDSKKVSVAYYRSPVSPAVKNSAAAVALAAAQWTNSSAAPPTASSESTDDIEHLAEYSASLYAKTTEEYESYLEYYREYYRKERCKDYNEDVSTSAKVAASASQNHKRVELAALGSHSSIARTDQERPVASQGTPRPDLSRFKLDESSGYYFDSTSGLYYDLNTHYYYDTDKQQFMYWDEATMNYIMVPKENANAISEKTDSSEANPKKVKKGPKVKVAKNVAKEMEKWAKTLNQKKEFNRLPYFTATETSLVSENLKSDPQTSNSSVSNSKNEQKMSESQESICWDIPVDLPRTVLDDCDPRFIDVVKLACLLCKRQFSSNEILMKHVKLSDLHKQNLAVALGNSEESSVSYSDADGSYNTLYRDRAKERRKMFGSESGSASNSLKDLYMQVKQDMETSYSEEPNTTGINGNNIGNKMLQKMGWQAGQGLGKDNRGIVDPIMAERRVGKVGLGVLGAELVTDSDDRQTIARKMTLARYKNLN